MPKPVLLRIYLDTVTVFLRPSRLRMRSEKPIDHFGMVEVMSAITL